MLTSILITVFTVVASIIMFFLVLPFITIVLSFLGGEKIKTKEIKKEFDFGCIITAYRNADITKPLIQSLLRQNYKNFEIYLVADDCKIEGWDLFDERLTVLNPTPPLKLKAKSIIHAIENYKRKHDYSAVFDADNLAHPDFLKILNLYANNGMRSIQGQRTAKNLDTMYACADSTGEFYKNYIERYAPYLIGSSSVISGSGMAVEYDLYNEYLNSPEIQQGKEKWKKMLQEDKILQNFLLNKKEKISYAWDAVIYDEKVVSGDQVETQRSRWLFSYFQNLPNSTGFVLKGLFGLNFNQFFFGLMTVSPPMFILLFIAVIFMIGGVFIAPAVSVGLFIALAIFSLNVLFSLYLSKVPTQIWSALWGLPLFILSQIKGLFKISNPNKNFKHSEHTRSVSIDDVLKNSPEKITHE